MPRQLTILAPGLLGASLGRAAFQRGLTDRVVVWARREEVRQACLAEGWCRAACEDPREAVAGAGLVVICTPVTRIVPLLTAVADALPEDVVVTDVGSTKGQICRSAESILPPRRHFVGSHPMAGSEKSGHENASEELFEGRVCFVTPTEGSDAAAVQTVQTLWQEIGMRVIRETPEAHDAIVARLSHVPHLTATALCLALSEHPADWVELAGGGLRDTTRVAAGQPGMWRDICEENREAILTALGELQESLGQIHQALQARDFDHLQALLERGRAYRRQID